MNNYIRTINITGVFVSFFTLSLASCYCTSHRDFYHTPNKSTNKADVIQLMSKTELQGTEKSNGDLVYTKSGLKLKYSEARQHFCFEKSECGILSPPEYIDNQEFDELITLTKDSFEAKGVPFNFAYSNGRTTNLH